MTPGETAPGTVTASDKEARVASAAEFVDAIGRMAAERDTAIAQAKVAEARASAAERECDRLRDRGRSIIDACERIREDRDAAIARAEKAEAARDKARAMASEQPARILGEVLGYLYPGRVEDGSRIASAVMLDIEHGIATLRDRAKQAEAERDAERAYRVAFHSMIANARGDISAIQAPDARAVREAESALRALGVTP